MHLLSWFGWDHLAGKSFAELEALRKSTEAKIKEISGGSSAKLPNTTDLTRLSGLNRELEVIGQHQKALTAKEAGLSKTVKAA